MIGVYRIKNIINNHDYIGSSVNVEKRINDHIKSLNNNSHYNSRLQNSWNKYGESAFNAAPMISTTKDCIRQVEQWYLDHHKPFFNYAKIATGGHTIDNAASITVNNNRGVSIQGVSTTEWVTINNA